MAKRKKKEEDVDSYKHEFDTHKKAVPVSLTSYDTSKPKLKKYDMPLIFLLLSKLYVLIYFNFKELSAMYLYNPKRLCIF